MISNQACAQLAYAEKAIDSGLISKQYDPTVRENIDSKIAYYKQAILELEQSKEQLAPLLDVKISMMRNAMNY